MHLHAHIKYTVSEYDVTNLYNEKGYWLKY